jgi:hypothetical protein
MGVREGTPIARRPTRLDNGFSGESFRSGYNDRCSSLDKCFIRTPLVFGASYFLEQLWPCCVSGLTHNGNSDEYAP